MNKNYKLINFLDMVGSNQIQLAEIIGVSYATIQNKIIGKSHFTAKEISLIKDKFQLTAEEVAELFL